MFQQNPSVLNWDCQLTHGDLYNGHKTVVVVIVVILPNRSNTEQLS